MSNGASASRPHVLVLNQYYWPGVEATAKLLDELCRGLVDDFDVTVVTGTVGGEEAGRFRRDGVDVIRVSSTAYERSRLSRRALNYVTYLALAVRRSLSVRRPDVVLCMTDPPFVGDAALLVARRYRVPLVVISQDVFPEIAVAVGRMDNPVLVRVFDAAVRFYLRHADHVVAIGDTMRARLEEKGAPPERLSVIHNWVDARALQPASRDNDWARAQRLTRRFVVMHSGNVGHAQDLTTLVRAFTFLRDLKRLELVVIGEGALKKELVALARLHELERVRFLPYQPREVLSQTLSSADVHVVGLGRGLSGYVVPSRLAGIMAVGRPVIVSAQGSSEIVGVVERAGCGIVVPPGRPELLAAAIRDAHDGRYDLAAMGERARAYVVGENDRSLALERYRALLHEVTAP